MEKGIFAGSAVSIEFAASKDQLTRWILGWLLRSNATSMATSIGKIHSNVEFAILI